MNRANGRLHFRPISDGAGDDARPGAPPIARPPLDGFLDGYALDRVISPRAALEPLRKNISYAKTQLAMPKDELEARWSAGALAHLEDIPSRA